MLWAEIDEALGSSNRDVYRLRTVDTDSEERMLIQWAINDNLTSGMRAGGAQMDIRDMLEAPAQSSGRRPATSP